MSRARGAPLLFRSRERARPESARRQRDAFIPHNNKDKAPWLKKPLRRGGLRRLKGLPPYWRNLNSALAAPSPSEQRLNLWLLVLEAKKIPHRLFGGGRGLYVPCLYEKLALHDIRAVEAERPLPIFVPPARENLAVAPLFLGLLLVWHGLRFGWFPPLALPPPFPEDPKLWSAMFGLDMNAFRQGGALWRAGTALTLHADSAHLFSNLAFGLIFISALCRRAGFGFGLLLVILGGLCGNACNAIFQPLTDLLNPWFSGGARHVVSIGFSTSLFASMGALCALNAADIMDRSRAFTHLAPKRRGLAPAMVKGLGAPLAAGLALLGILGGGGEAGVDYAAHIWGFFCGLALSFCLLPLERRLAALKGKEQRRAQVLLLLAALAPLVLCWYAALVLTQVGQ